jgi:hypothetical protein
LLRTNSRKRISMDPETPDAFEAIAHELADLRREAQLEQEGEAREIVAAGLAARPFVEELRRVPAGDVVTVVPADGEPLRGRILGVGADWMRLGEVGDTQGTGRVRVRRTHDIRLEAIARLSREVER